MIDNFYFVETVQKCRDYVENVIDWLLKTKQVMVTNVLQRLRLTMEALKKGCSVLSVVDEASESFKSKGGKSQWCNFFFR